MPKLIGCPLDAAFTKRDCATKRGPKLGCPGTCPHYPFSSTHIDELRQLEKFVFHNANALINKKGLSILEGIVSDCDAVLKDLPEDIIPRQVLVPWATFSVLFTHGVWESYRPGKHDEAVLGEYLSQVRFYVLETAHSQKPGVAKVYNSLGSEKWDIVDDGMAALDSKIMFLCMGVPMADHFRAYGNAWGIDPLTAPRFISWIKAQAKEWGLSDNDFLTFHFPKVIAGYVHLVQTTIPDLHQSKAVYDWVVAEDEIVSQLSQNQDIAEMSDGYLLTSVSQPKTPEGHTVGFYQQDTISGRYALGLIQLSPSVRQLHFISPTLAGFNAGRALLEKEFQGCIRYVGEEAIALEELSETLRPPTSPEDGMIVHSKKDLEQLPATMRYTVQEQLCQRLESNILQLPKTVLPALGESLPAAVHHNPDKVVDLLRLHWTQAEDMMGETRARSVLTKLMDQIHLPLELRTKVWGTT